MERIRDGPLASKHSSRQNTECTDPCRDRAILGVEDGKPVLANAINEWARQRTLTAVLDNPARSDPRSGGEASAAEPIARWLAGSNTL
jgi:hypothetical protein